MSKQTFRGTVTNICRGTIDSHQTPFPLFSDIRYRPEKHRKCCRLQLRSSQGWGLDSGPRLLHVGKDVVTVMISHDKCSFSWLYWYSKVPSGYYIGSSFHLLLLWILQTLWLQFFNHKRPWTWWLFFLSKYLIFKLLIWYQHLCVHGKLYLDTLQWNICSFLLLNYIFSFASIGIGFPTKSKIIKKEKITFFFLLAWVTMF